MVYNLGQQDLVVRELATKINDGKYHVIRFTRDGVNSTLQVDDNQVSRDSTISKNICMLPISTYPLNEILNKLWLKLCQAQVEFK